MNTKTKCYAVLGAVVLAGFLLIDCLAQRMPQDNWYLAHEWEVPGADQASPIAVGPDETIYVGHPSGIHAYNSTGELLRIFGGSAGLISVNESNLVYAVSRYSGLGYLISIYSPAGSLMTSWSVPQGLVTWRDEVYSISPSADGSVHIGSWAEVLYCDFFGSVITNWGGEGILDGQFDKGVQLITSPDGLVFCGGGDSDSLQIFDRYGGFIRRINNYTYARSARYKSFFSGFIFLLSDNLFSDIVLSNPDYYPAGYFLTQYELEPNTSFRMFDADLSRFGNLFMFGTSLLGGAPDRYLVKRFENTYRTVPSFNRPPQPQVLSVSQRPGTAYLDIRYSVEDYDSTNVTTAAIAFPNGQMSLGELLVVDSLVEGTETNVGANIAANTVYKLVWNVGADWSTNFGSVSIAILANDGQPLLGRSFITIPAGGTNSELIISQSPVDDGFEWMWYWLIATNNPTINLVSGKVYGVDGSYDGLELAGSSTTPTGKAYLLEMLNLREATTTEVARARAGPAGLNNVWSPRVSAGPGRWPSSVNEFGFDAGSGGTFVVPLD